MIAGLIIERKQPLRIKPKLSNDSNLGATVQKFPLDPGTPKLIYICKGSGLHACTIERETG